MTHAPTTATRYEPLGSFLRWSMLIVAGAGAAVTFAILTQSFGSTLPGCGGGSGCDAVFTSPWSKIAGVPVAVPALLVYLGIIAALQFITPDRPHAVQRKAWHALILLAGLAALAAAWFIFVQLYHLHTACIYCLTAHGCSLVLASLIFANAPIGARRVLPDDPDDPMMIAPPTALATFAVAALAVALLAAVQTIAPPPTSATSQIAGDLPPDTDTETYFFLNEDRIPVRLGRRDFPVLGSPTAPHVLVYMFDYTCPHCRALHAILEEAIERYGPDQLAVLALPTPLSSACNPHTVFDEPHQREGCDLARWALRVWRAAPQHFAAYDQWLFDSPTPRTADEAAAKAAEMLGPDAFEQAARDHTPNELIEQTVTLYGHTGAGRIPILFMRNASIKGNPSSAELYDMLENRFGLQPR